VRPRAGTTLASLGFRSNLSNEPDARRSFSDPYTKEGDSGTRRAKPRFDTDERLRSMRPEKLEGELPK
jgi:hypothetical protein